MSHVMGHLWPTEIAMDPPPANSTTIQSGLVRKKNKTQKPKKNIVCLEIFQKISSKFYNFCNMLFDQASPVNMFPVAARRDKQQQ